MVEERGRRAFVARAHVGFWHTFAVDGTAATLAVLWCEADTAQRSLALLDFLLAQFDSAWFFDGARFN
jgi:hypothetical protein